MSLPRIGLSWVIVPIRLTSTLLAVAFSLLLVPRLASAGQTPQAATPPPPPPPKVEGTAEASVVATTGNSSTDTIGLGAGLIYRPSAWVLDSKVAFVRTEADSVVSARSLAAASRLSRELSPRTSLFVQYDFLNNRLAGIDQRHTLVGGVSYKAVNTSRQTLRVDAGVGLASETPVALPHTSTGTVLGGGAYKVKISDTSDFIEEARIVESLSHGGDWRFDNSAAVTAKLTTKLSLKVSHATHVVNLPTPGFKKTDTIASVALVAKF
jgi:putative salt-induced outer membrane protein